MRERKKASEITRLRIAKGRTLVKIGEIWYLETCQRGVQKRRSLGVTKYDEALKVQSQLETAGDELPGAQAKKPEELPAALTLGKASEEYLAWYGRVNRKSSLERTSPFVKMFVSTLGENRDPKVLTRADIQAWLDSRRGTLSPHTMRTDFNRLRAFIYWIADMKSSADRSICRRIELPKPKKGAKPAPSPEKIRSVIRALGDHWVGDYFRVLVETGMRPSELLGIRGTDLRDATDEKGRPAKSLRIAPTEERDLKTEASERVILLSETAAQILSRRKDAMLVKSGPLFPNYDGKIFQEGSAYHLFRDLLAGGKGKKVPPELDVTLYDARHHFCSEKAAPGPNHMPIEELATYIGHSSASTQTLMKHYVDARALLRGKPTSMVPIKDGEVLEMKKASGHAE